jgi:anti-sigma-K factor RskA
MTDWLGMIPNPRAPRPALKAQVLARALQPLTGRRWRLAAAAVLVAAAVGAGAWWAGTTISELEAELALVRGSAARVTWIPITTAGRPGSVTIFADSATRRWLVRCEGMAPNAKDQTYQIWFITGTGMKPAAVMTMKEDEARVMTMTVPVPADVGRVWGAAMSIEPRGGSAQPQGPIVFQLRL